MCLYRSSNWLCHSHHPHCYWCKTFGWNDGWLQSWRAAYSAWLLIYRFITSPRVGHLSLPLQPFLFFCIFWFWLNIICHDNLWKKDYQAFSFTFEGNLWHLRKVEDYGASKTKFTPKWIRVISSLTMFTCILLCDWFFGHLGKLFKLFSFIFKSYAYTICHFGVKNFM